MEHLCFLALDFGAESGRAIRGTFERQQLQLFEVHRFPNIPVRLPGGLHWDVLRLWAEVKQCITQALAGSEDNLASIGIDTWAVDFGLLDRQGALIGTPFHYRDSRTDNMLALAFERVPRAEIFDHTGIQFLPLNSLYQLLAMAEAKAPALDIAQTFLTIPDLFNYWLTGSQVCEFTNATTTQCYNPRLKDWDRHFVERFGIPSHIFPEIVPPGTDLGALRPEVAAEVGLGAASLRVIAPATHDTGSAVVAVPAQAPNFAWISSGTWSVVGTEVPQPVITDQSLRHNFTNEGGVCDTFRFSRNVMGLWLVQECRRTWESDGDSLTYSELTNMAAEAEPFLAVLDPDHVEFFKPGDMPGRIRAYCQQTGQPIPETRGAVVRCALEGIALKYRWVLEKLEEMSGHRLEPLYIVGGGTQNRLLSQFTADAIGRPVVTGPIEATAIGNILMQMMATGHLDSLSEGRALVRSSFELLTYEPREQAPWDEAYARLLMLMTQS